MHITIQKKIKYIFLIIFLFLLYNKLYSFSIISARGVVLEARIIKEVKTKQEL